jgi:hypothetical protein
MTHKSGLYFIFGAWLSIVGLVAGGATLIPVTSEVKSLSPAAIYRAALHEELRESTTLPALGKVIAVDEAGKKITLYEDGTSTKAFRVISFATPLSLYEVPTGSYAVSGKEPQHLSRRSGLWMPYAIEFGDNYFIHGTPVDKDGDVSVSNDGISIELSDSDANEVYDFASVGVKIIVTGGLPRSSFASSSRYYLRGEGKLPNVTAPSFSITDIETGDVLWERNANAPYEEGVLVSFATALTAIETLDQYKNVRIGELLLTGKAGSRRPPSRDDELPLGSLIYPLLFDANQTARDALLRELGSNTLTAYMTERAVQLGMTDTHFASNVYVEESTTSARDLTRLFRYVFDHEHYLLDVSLSPDHELFASSGAFRYRWENKNPWVLGHAADYAGGLGTISLTGRGSGMFIFRVPFGEFDERIISFVIIDSSNIEGDVATIKSFIKEHYQYGIRREGAAASDRERRLIDRLKGLLREEIVYERDL